jgi:hypothetical protein
MLESSFEALQTGLVYCARLTFMFKVIEGLEPAIAPSDFVSKTRPKRLIKSRQYSDFISQNIVENISLVLVILDP